jgi:hypothetical protein
MSLVKWHKKKKIKCIPLYIHIYWCKKIETFLCIAWSITEITMMVRAQEIWLSNAVIATFWLNQQVTKEILPLIHNTSRLAHWHGPEVTHWHFILNTLFQTKLISIYCENLCHDKSSMINLILSMLVIFSVLM